jgi:membrane-associated HD superfamily phosphohydrolase
MNKVRTDMLEVLGLSHISAKDLMAPHAVKMKVNEEAEIPTDGRKKTVEGEVQKVLNAEKAIDAVQQEPIEKNPDNGEEVKEPPKKKARRRTKAQIAADELREATKSDDPHADCQKLLSTISQSMGQAGLLRVRQSIADAIERQGGPVDPENPKVKISNVGDTEIYAVLNDMKKIVDEAAENS